MRKLLVLGASLAVLAFALSAGTRPSARVESAGVPDTTVAYWDNVATQVYAAAGFSPPDAFPLYSYLGISIYDSVVAVKGGYEPFAIKAARAPNASAEAAVAAAANRILSNYVPGQVGTIIAPAYAQALSKVPDGSAKTAGIALGEQVANAVIAMRAGDGFRSAATYTTPSPPVPGVWIPTAPSAALGANAKQMKPFTQTSLNQLRPQGPASLSSDEWVREYEEVRQMGSATSTMRTPEQTVAARFWAEAPVQQLHGALRKFITDRQLDIVSAARAMAMVEVSQADAGIACFEAKYQYAFWRPITAVRAGDTDGNPGTIGDPMWTPLLPATPNHPEYPSAHSCVTPAVAVALATFLGTTNIEFTVPSLTGLGDRYYKNIVDLNSEVANARVWGGIHFRSAIEDGTEIAMKAAHIVLTGRFGPTGN
jgi:hypothetical protein